MNILEILIDYRWLVIGVLAFFILNARCSDVDGSLRRLSSRLDGIEVRLDELEGIVDYEIDDLEQMLRDLYIEMGL